MNFKKLTYLLIFIFSSKFLFAQEVPIIVIAPGKTYQSESAVGSDVTMLSNSVIKKSSEFFLGDILSKNLNGMNYYQSGGYGTTSGIQLRGLPKRYSVVYIDGVKMSDPSTPSNDYYFNHLMTNSLDRVEILKGAQTSLYGSGAIAGTVNIFSKKGREGHHRNFNVSTASRGTKNLNFSFDGKTNNYDYFVGLTNFSTDGVSAMNDNDENDKYRNDDLTANFGYDLSDKIRIENYFRYADSFLQYDEVTNGRLDSNNTDDQEGIYSLKMTRDEGNLKNTLSYNKTIFQRNVTEYSGSKKNYKASRDAVNLLGEYNFNLDTKIVYGLDHEFEEADMKTYYTNNNYITQDEAIYSQYMDLQFRPTDRLFSSIGIRRDTHTTAGSFETGRATLAFNYDYNTKIRTTLGTGLRFGSLDEYHYEQSLQNKQDLKPEESLSFDIGLDKLFSKYNLELKTTLFFNKYDNHMLNWSSNTDAGKQPSGSVYMNTNAKVESKGLEIASMWKPNKKLSLNLGYTLTDVYDGSTCDNPNYADYMKLYEKCNDDMTPRVPRHSVNFHLNNEFSKKLNTSLFFKYASERRDFGNGNQNYEDVILSHYATLDLAGTYNMFNNYNLYFLVSNLFDNHYEEAYQYSTMGRSINFGLKREY